jgi:hypothetical protein
MEDVKVEAPPSTAEPIAAQEPAKTGTEAVAAAEVNFERVLAGDEKYIAEINAKLAEEPPAEAPATEVPEVKTEEKPAAPVLDPEEIVETIVFRGQEIGVKRKDQKTLLQKGRSLDSRMSELSHLIALEREAPDIANLARTPEGRKQVIERIRRQEQVKEIADADIPDIEGYDKADVAAVAKISQATLQAQLKKMGITPTALPLSDEQTQKAQATDQADLAKETALTLRVMRRADREFEPKFELLKQIMAKAKLELPPEQYGNLFNKVNDPRQLHPETGEPIFTHFWENVVTPEYNKLKQSNQPAAPAVPAIHRKEQIPAGRMAPGSAMSPSMPSKPVDLTSLPQEAFDRAFREALARG